MSIGVGGEAKLYAVDSKEVVYEYCGYNLNKQEFINKNKIYDGIISINRKCFVEPEIHTKKKKMPSGRKKIISKKIIKEVNYLKLIDEKLIEVINCSNCWKTLSDEKSIDIVALQILGQIFTKYQENGEVPLKIGYYK